MNADVILKKKEDAVSPVIGVMLMLVVTIVIAAVVAAFATGLGGDVDMAPTVGLNAVVYDDGYVVISSLSGERLIKSEIDVKLQLNGEELGSASLGNSNEYFGPGSIAKVKAYNDGEGENDKLKADQFVTVVVTSEDKFVVLSKEVMIKKAA